MHMRKSPIIEEPNQFWTVHQVPYRGKRKPVDLLKVPLDHGKRRTQDSWSEFSKDARSRNEFYVGDVPLYHALFSTLYKHRKGPQHKMIEGVRTFLQQQFCDHWLTTLTRVTYMPSGKDKVTHNYGQADRYTVLESMVGPDERVKDARNSRAYKALFGTDNVGVIHDIYQWITNTFFARISNLLFDGSKPEKKLETVARFVADADLALLDCGGDPQCSYSALGVRVRASEASIAQQLAPTLEAFLEFSLPSMPTRRRDEYESQLRKEFK